MDPMVAGTIAAMLAISFILYSIGAKCNDHMFRWFGVAFILFATSRVIHALKIDLLGPGGFQWDLLIVLLLYGAGSLALIQGAINSRRVYIETPIIVGASIIWASIMASTPEGHGTYPLAFSLFVGSFVASVFLIKRDTGDRRCNAMHDYFGALLLVRGVIALASATLTRFNWSGFSREGVIMSDLTVLIMILIVGIVLSRCRVLQKGCREGVA